MLAESLSPLHPSTNSRGHAHPPPATTVMAADTKENQRLTEFLAGVAFDVEIRGLAASSDAPAYEMYHPKLRKSNVTQQAVIHLDTISCWKGISYIQALELALWERLFRHCLVSRIQERLQHSIVTQLSNRKDRIDKTNLLLCLIQSFPKDSTCLLDIELSCLFRDMTDAFCEDHHCQITAANFPWSFSSGDFSRFVYNFLSTQDCFKSTPAGPCVSVNCSIDWFTFPFVAVTADVAWYPPAIEFKHVPTQIRPRAHYVIVPCHGRVMEDPHRPENRPYPEFTEYVAKKSTSKIQWDHRAELFRAQAPDRMGANDAGVSETILHAKIIRRFPGNVRFESTSRHAVTVKLLDTGRLETATDNNRSVNSSIVTPFISSRKRISASEPFVCQNMPRFFLDSPSEQHHEKELAEITDGVALRHNGNYPDSGDSEKPTRKRSNSLCECKPLSPEGHCLHNSNSGPNAELKRRKLDQANMTNMGGVPSNEPDRATEIQYPTPPCTPSTSSSNYSEPQIQFISPVGTQASPALHTSAGLRGSSPLSQGTIQHNYREFEKMALQKMTNQPGSGDVSFKKIFLGDSEAEDWHSSDLDELSDDVDDMEMIL